MSTSSISKPSTFPRSAPKLVIRSPTSSPPAQSIGFIFSSQGSQSDSIAVQVVDHKDNLSVSSGFSTLRQRIVSRTKTHVDNLNTAATTRDGGFES